MPCLYQVSFAVGESGVGGDPGDPMDAWDEVKSLKKRRSCSTGAYEKELKLGVFFFLPSLLQQICST